MSMPRIPWDQPLTPLSFLERSALVFAERTAVIDGDRRYTYREFADRCARLAGGLIELGVRQVTGLRCWPPTAG
jgi:non-ribosomal peptide synthetase component E (peptide arylation enzyme)